MHQLIWEKNLVHQNQISVMDMFGNCIPILTFLDQIWMGPIWKDLRIPLTMMQKQPWHLMGVKLYLHPYPAET